MGNTAKTAEIGIKYLGGREDILVGGGYSTMYVEYILYSPILYHIAP